MQEAADRFEAEKMALLREKDNLINEKRLANANIYLLRDQQGQENQDFTKQMSFDELEHTYYAFKKFYKEQWKLAKKAIRNDLLKSKDSPNGDSKGATDTSEEDRGADES